MIEKFIVGKCEYPLQANNPLLIKRTVIKIQINVVPQICKIVWAQRTLQKGKIQRLDTIRIASQRRHTNN